KKDGSLLTAQDVIKSTGLAQKDDGGQVLKGVTAHLDPDFSRSIQQGGEITASGPAYAGQDYEVEYIVGGSSRDGAATTFMVRIENGGKMQGEDQ
ncbi:MAG TPA: hypothetical protein VJ969_03385, partial [Desulfopila sp.]|nr:hypothetical protein [Desulfopila sp.]